MFAFFGLITVAYAGVYGGEHTSCTIGSDQNARGIFY